ncbi:hypothetical protein LTR10_023512 [Elasticomyces elasticus]|nr:hypothetical protein LTR10_023512 [Elasticomyces elasticus]
MTSTPAEMHTKLTSLRAAATQAYALKQYSVAAESFSEAAELQDQINGEMALENADILYQYGRCLYHVAVSNSDVLGGKVAGTGNEEPRRKKRKVVKDKADGGEGGGGEVIGDAMKAGGDLGTVEEEGEEGLMADTPVMATAAGAGAGGAAKPFFQITGDENWTDSEGDSDDGDDANDDDDQADAQAEEEEDDFAIAYEILDTARVLLAKKLAELQNHTSTNTSTSTDTVSAESRQVKERLADTHDLLAEISLENERFSDAVSDTRDALALKLELYPQESSLVAEAHFKLSLALEFASVTTTAADGKGEGGETQQVDEGMRGEAAGEMERAIASCLLRVAKEEAELARTEVAGSGGEVTAAQVVERRNGIKDVKEMITDMQQRLVDLRNPAVNLSGAPEGLEGLLGGLMGGGKEVMSKGEQQAEKIGRATDLGGLVRRKGKGKVEGEGGAGIGEAANGAVEVTNGKGKRKAEDGDGGEGESGVGGKKVKFEEGSVGGV